MTARHVTRIDHLSSTENDGYCIHGVYVGGCGIDWMCGDCEMGNYDVGERDMGRVIITGLNKEGKRFIHREEIRSIERAEQSAENWKGLLTGLVDDLEVTIEPSVHRFFYNADEEGQLPS